MDRLKLFNPDHLKGLCINYKLKPSKQYGQNFLIDPEPIEYMLEAAELKEEDLVVEVGPGFGVLTFALAERAKKVITFEIEKKLEQYWDKQMRRQENIKVIWGNVLQSAKDMKTIVGDSPYKVIANIPYQITSLIIRLFLESEQKPELLVFMTQKEVAERICAKPGDMSVLSISVQYYADAEIISVVSRHNYWPQPQVDSAIIKIKCKTEFKKDKEFNNQFFHLVKIGFANRRKLLIKNLEQLAEKTDKSQLLKIFEKLGFNPKIRAQELSVDDWKNLLQEM